MAQYYKGDTILKVENVSLDLDGKKILDNVNVEIKDILRVDGQTQGQIVGFVGPSGVGKTKFFEILAGILPPTTGKVLINKELKQAKIGDIGVVQQNFPLFNHRTVRANLEIGAAKTITDATERAKRIDSILARCGMNLHANHYPAQLSGGQKQRVAIAQQLLCTEHFLLMDEPFSGLDINMVDEISEMIVEISNKNEENTVIVVSHDIIATAAIADTIWVMGRDRDANGNVISGAYIKHNFDLCERGLAWSKDIKKNPDFIKLINEIRELFITL